MGALEQRTIVLTFFLILLIAYGTSIGGANVQNTINNLFAPWPSLQGLFAFKNCSWWDITCMNSNVATATAAVAVSIEYPAILFFTLLNRVNSFFAAINTILFGPEVGVATVPFLDIAFLGIIILPAVYEIFRMARGNASAGTL
jgi:hypothetical protein